SIAGTSESKGHKASITVVMRPKLRLSGTLDPGKVPEFSAAIELARYGKQFRMPAVGAVVLAVIVKSGKEYAVSPERPSFMPDDHARICEVKDFDDPRVLDSLRALQELRKKEKK